MIYDLLNKPKRNNTPEGTRYLNTYQEEINKKTGSLQLVRVGQTDIYERIQQDVPQTEIQNILHAVAMGDMAALKQREATYCDATTMPKSLMEAQNLAIRMKDEFYKMPIEVRKEFGNDPERYVSLMGTEEFKQIMAPFNDKVAAIAAEKNHKEYLKKVEEGAKLNIDIEREVARQKGVANE